MTIRERIANWLTGGDYQLRQDVRDLNYQHMIAALDQVGEYEDALEQIAAIEVTQSSNGQTRKAVRIAREALA